MNKEKDFNNEHIVVEALGVSIASLLLSEGKVAIPELGYLELKTFPDKQTVLFKGKENTTLFLTSEGSIQSQIYNHVSIPLKEGKVVVLPEIGIFRPMKNADGSYRISFTISSALRKLLNGTEDSGNEMEKTKEPVTTLVKEGDEKIAVPVVMPVAEVQKTEKGDNKKTQEKAIVAVPKREIQEEWKVPSSVRNPSKVGDVLVPQEEKEWNMTRIRPIIAAIAALIALIFIVWYFMPENKNRRGRAFVSEHDKLESAQMIDQFKSYESIDLPSLAEQKYGNRIFWIYIYEANRDKISSPVNIPAGTDLRIPNLWEDYKVDVMDSMEIKRAKILSGIVLKQKLQL